MAQMREFPKQSDQPSRYTFTCSHVGYQCDWHAEAASEEELMRQVEAHGRDAHNFQQLSEQKRFKIRNNIQRAA